MCTVWIVSPFGVRAVDPVALQPKARMEQAWGKPEVKRLKKVVAKKSVLSLAPAPLHCGGSLEKTFSSDRWSKKDSTGHYRQRCGEYNHREQVFHKTERRRQMVRY